MIRLSRRAFSAVALVLSGCGATERADAPSSSDEAVGGAAGHRQPGGGGGVAGGAGASVAGGTGGKGGPDGPFPAAPGDLVGVTGQTSIPTTLYSWTTPEQIAAIRAGGPLFSQDERPGLGPGQLVDYLVQRSADDPIAAALLTDEFRRGRYAWVNPWATCLGFEQETYGDELIAIELHEEAWFVLVYPQDGSIRVVDRVGYAVSAARVAEEPHRLGAVYFCTGMASYGTTFWGGAGGYREMYVGNMAMVKRWSVRTQALVHALAGFAQRLRATPTTPPTESPEATDEDWKHTAFLAWNPGTDLSRYAAALCFLDARYRPTPTNLELLASTLEARMQDEDPIDVVL